MDTILILHFQRAGDRGVEVGVRWKEGRGRMRVGVCNGNEEGEAVGAGWDESRWTRFGCEWVGSL